MENIMRAGIDTALHVVAPTKGWFEENRENLQPDIQAKISSSLSNAQSR